MQTRNMLTTCADCNFMIAWFLDYRFIPLHYLLFLHIERATTKTIRYLLLCNTPHGKVGIIDRLDSHLSFA